MSKRVKDIYCYYPCVFPELCDAAGIRKNIRQLFTGFAVPLFFLKRRLVNPRLKIIWSNRQIRSGQMS